MGLIFKEIEVSNIRSHKHKIFTPSENGITVISGANGAGKSTIVDSIAWALYGTKPVGVKKANELCRNGIPFTKQNKFFVKVTFTFNGFTYRVERRIINRGGQVECDIYKIEPDGTDKHLAGAAVSDASKYIRNLLKLDESGFLTAVLVQQKQVDYLISASAKDRGLIIEKLTGISAINIGIKEAKEKARDAKALKDAFGKPVEQSEIEELKAQLETNQTESLKMTSNVTKIVDNLNTLDTELAETYKKKELIETNRKRLRDLETKTIEEKSRLKSLTAQITDLDNKKAAKEPEFHAVSTYNDNTKVERLKEVQENFSTLEKTAFKIAAENESKADRLAYLKSNLGDFGPNEAAEIPQLEADINDLKTLIQESNNRLGGLRSDREKLVKAIEALTEDDGTCPTCLQSVNDMEVAVQLLKAEKSRVVKNGKKLKEKIAVLDDDLLGKNNTLIKNAQLENELSEWQTLNADLTRKKDILKETNKELRSLQSELDDLTVYVDNYSTMVTVKSDLDLINKDRDKLLKMKESLDVSLNQIEKEQDSLGDIVSLDPDTVYQTIDNLNSRKSNLMLEKQQLESSSALLLSKNGYLVNEITRIETGLERFNQILLDVEETSNIVKTLEEFKADTISDSIPKIEDFASELLGSFTDGSFIGVKLDDKFRVSVTKADGMVSAFGMLSGGEQSAAAMALRVAIALLLNGNDNNSIILDEVLVSQDKDRASLILNGVRDVCNGQIILIAHNESINEMADKVVTL